MYTERFVNWQNLCVQFVLLKIPPVYCHMLLPLWWKMLLLIHVYGKNKFLLNFITETTIRITTGPLEISLVSIELVVIEVLYICIILASLTDLSNDLGVLLRENSGVTE